MPLLAAVQKAGIREVVGQCSQCVIPAQAGIQAPWWCKVCPAPASLLRSARFSPGRRGAGPLDSRFRGNDTNGYPPQPASASPRPASPAKGRGVWCVIPAQAGIQAPWWCKVCPAPASLLRSARFSPGRRGAGPLDSRFRGNDTNGYPPQPASASPRPASPAKGRGGGGRRTPPVRMPLSPGPPVIGRPLPPGERRVGPSPPANLSVGRPLPAGESCSGFLLPQE